LLTAAGTPSAAPENLFPVRPASPPCLKTQLNNLKSYQP
jgi:hypothetical protein